MVFLLFFNMILFLPVYYLNVRLSVCAHLLSCVRLLQPQRLQPARLLCPWDFPGKNTQVSCHFLLQGIFPTQGSNPHLLHWQVDSLPLRHPGSCKKYIVKRYFEILTDQMMESVLGNLWNLKTFQSTKVHYMLFRFDYQCFFKNKIKERTLMDTTQQFNYSWFHQQLCVIIQRK